MREFSAGRPAVDFSERATDRRRAREVRRNSRLLILNGGLMFMAMTLASADMVLPAFVQTLTTSTVMIGLAGALMRIGWAWPQVFISRIVETWPQKMRLLLVGGFARSAIWVLIGALTFWMGERHPGFLLPVFFLLYATATSMMGITNVPWMDIIGKTIPSRERARMFSLRRLLGGGMAMLSGVLISYVLSERSGLRFPSNYALLFVLSGLGTGLSIATFGMVREPIEAVRKRRLSLAAYMASGFKLLVDDANYRRFCLVQLLSSFSMMTAPFLVPYALSNFGIGTVYVGVFVAVLQFSTIVSNVMWAYVGHRKGNRALLVYGSYFLALSTLVPLLVGYVPDRTVVPLAAWGIGAAFNLRIAFYGLTFVFTGFATSGMFTGRMAYVLDIAPPERRPSYTSFMNVFMLPQGFLPVLAGALIAWISYWNMFLIALLFSPLSIVMTHLLKDVREKEA